MPNLAELATTRANRVARVVADHHTNRSDPFAWGRAFTHSLLGVDQGFEEFQPSDTDIGRRLRAMGWGGGA